MAEPIALDSLSLADGLAFGGWSLWLVNPDDKPEDHDYLLIQPGRGWAIRLTLCNGWFQYRVSSGEWYTAFTEELSESYEDTFETASVELMQRLPASNLPRGEYRGNGWLFEVSADRVVIRHPKNDGTVTVYRERDLWTWCKKVARYVEEG